MHSSQIISFLRYQITRPYHNGHGLHSPFLFGFATSVLYKKQQSSYKLQQIKALRKQLLKDDTVLTVEDLGAGSLSITHNDRKISHIARYSSSSSKQGKLLHAMVHYFKPDNIIEVGTCLGLGTLYLATGNPSVNVITLEGSKALAMKATQNFKQLQVTNINQLIGDFSETLPEALSMTEKCDFIYVDGNHTKEATLLYFEIILSHIHDQMVIVFDDIRWSKPMKEAWDIICSHQQVSLSLDLFHLGIVFLNPKLKKQHFMLYS